MYIFSLLCISAKEVIQTPQVFSKLIGCKINLQKFKGTGFHLLSPQ